MTSNNPYKIEFLPAALHDVTEIITSFVMLGSKNGTERIIHYQFKIIKSIRYMIPASIKFLIIFFTSVSSIKPIISDFFSCIF